MLLDVFMAFLVLVGGIQFVYCVVAGNYVRLIYSTFPSDYDILHTYIHHCYRCLDYFRWAIDIQSLLLE